MRKIIRCSVCFKESMKSPHHLVTRGAGGGDDPVNLLPLCVEHHVEVHNTGRWTFAKKYGIEQRLQAAIDFAHEKGKEKLK